MAMATAMGSSALLTPLSASSWRPALSTSVSRRAATAGRRFTTLRVRASAQKQKRENVETPNISTPPLPTESVPPPPEEGKGSEEEKALSLDEIGQELKAMRIASGEAPASSSPGDFFSGVVEETKLVEWPQFGKVLGTTGVVVGIIFGSAILLLTVNAGLAELSDQVFNGGSEFAKSWTRGSF